MIKSKAIIYNPYPVQGGGGEIQESLLEIIIKSLPRFEVEVFSSATSSSSFRLYFSRFINVYKNRFKFTNCDLLIIQSVFDFGSILIGYYARRNKINYIIIPRGDYVPNSKNVFRTKNYLLKRLIWSLFGRHLVNNALAVVVTSEFEKARLIDVYARHDHIEIIPDPTFDMISENVSLSELRNNEFNKFLNYPFALWMGRFAREKGLELIVDAWPAVQKKCSLAKLLLVGSITHQDEFDSIVKKINSLNLSDSIHIINWVSGIEKNFLLSNARCLLLPSFYESFGIVVSESLSFRTPVIVSDGTPWKGISYLAGKCIPRDTKIWSDEITFYIESKNKIRVPDDIIYATLNPYSKTSIFDLWNSLFKKYFINT